MYFFTHLTMILSGHDSIAHCGTSVAVQSNSHLLWVIENKAVYHSGKPFVQNPNLGSIPTWSM